MSSLLELLKLNQLLAITTSANTFELITKIKLIKTFTLKLKKETYFKRPIVTSVMKWSKFISVLIYLINRWTSFDNIFQIIYTCFLNAVKYCFRILKIINVNFIEGYTLIFINLNKLKHTFIIRSRRHLLLKLLKIDFIKTCIC